MKPKTDQPKDVVRWREQLKSVKGTREVLHKKKKKSGKSDYSKDGVYWKPQRGPKKKQESKKTADDINTHHAPSTAPVDLLMSGASNVGGNETRRKSILEHVPFFHKSDSVAQASAKSSPHTTRSSTSAWSSILKDGSSSASKDSSGVSKSARLKSIFRRLGYRDSKSTDTLSKTPTGMSNTESSVPRQDEDSDLAPEKEPETNSIDPGPKSAQKQPSPTTRWEPSRRLVQQLREGLGDSEKFVDAWESKILPSLEKEIEEVYSDDYVITFQYGAKPGHRVVEIMTTKELSDIIGHTAKETIWKNLPEHFHSRTTVRLVTGEIHRCTDEAITSPSVSDSPEDGFEEPVNKEFHVKSMIGDSVGSNVNDLAATLGPLVKVGDRHYWLVNYHAFDNPGMRAWVGLKPVPDCQLLHPCPGECPEGTRPRLLGELVAHSGRLYMTTRPSESLRRFYGDRTARVVTDWALCKSVEQLSSSECNRLRVAPCGREVESASEPVIDVLCGHPKSRLIHSTGRASGYGYGLVCEAPALARKARIKTREWFIQRPKGVETGGDMPESQWNLAGLGVPGDSGAAIVDFETNKLIGQVWGRNVYGGEHATERLTYFTSILDIFDDVVQRYPELGRPTLGGENHEECPRKPKGLRIRVPDPVRSSSEDTGGSAHVTGAESPCTSATSDDQDQYERSVTATLAEDGTSSQQCSPRPGSDMVGKRSASKASNVTCVDEAEVGILLDCSASSKNLIESLDKETGVTMAKYIRRVQIG